MITRQACGVSHKLLFPQSSMYRKKQQYTTENENGYLVAILLMRLDEEGRDSLVRESPTRSLTPSTTVHHRLLLPNGKHSW
jgi:hypothetical protein